VNVVLLQAADLIECPVNPAHSLMPRSLDKHLSYCPLTSKGYSKNEIVSVYVKSLAFAVFIYVHFCSRLSTLHLSKSELSHLCQKLRNFDFVLMYRMLNRVRSFAMLVLRWLYPLILVLSLVTLPH